MFMLGAVSAAADFGTPICNPYWLLCVNFTVQSACRGITAQEICHVDVQQSSVFSF